MWQFHRELVDDRGSAELELGVLSIIPKIPEFKWKMESSISVSSDRKIRNHLWR